MLKGKKYKLKIRESFNKINGIKIENSVKKQNFQGLIAVRKSLEVLKVRIK